MKGEIKEIDSGFWTIRPVANGGTRVGREFRGKTTDANVQVGDAVEYEVEETSTGPKLGKVTVLNPREPAPDLNKPVLQTSQPDPNAVSEAELKDLAAGPKE